MITVDDVGGTERSLHALYVAVSCLKKLPSTVPEAWSGESSPKRSESYRELLNITVKLQAEGFVGYRREV